MHPMLAGPIDQREIPFFCDQPDWWFSQKVDGWRKLVTVTDGKVAVVNRRGQPADLPKPAVAELSTLTKGPWTLDCELLHGVLWAFDMPAAEGFVTPRSPYRQRREVLEHLFGVWGDHAHVRLLPCARTPRQKAKLAKRLLEAKAEGVILNHTNAPYQPGPRRSPKVLKAKFCHDIDAVVTRLRIGGHDNFEVAVYRDDKLVVVGECTRGAGDGAKVQVNDVVTIKYLHASADHQLINPTLPRLRDDKAPEECTWDQLVYGSKEVLTDA